MNKLKEILGGDTRQFGMIFALIALIVFFQIITGGVTLTPDNIIALFNGNSYILVLAIGMVLVIIAGHIDLSVGSVAAAVGIIVAMAMDSWQLAWPLAIILGLVVGALIGAWQGFWTAYVGIPAFIVTLSGTVSYTHLDVYKRQLLILDEPTAALNEEDSRHLLGLIDELRRKGITAIIISHKLNEIAAIADSITCLLYTSRCV